MLIFCQTFNKGQAFYGQTVDAVFIQFFKSLVGNEYYWCNVLSGCQAVKIYDSFGIGTIVFCIPFNVEKAYVKFIATCIF